MYLGIDPTSSEQKPSGCAILEPSGRFRLVQRLATDAEIIDLARRELPLIVAIDAPLFYPRGWHCLEWPCPEKKCPPPERGLRIAERELYRLGIGLYATTKRSFIKKMIYRAVDLKHHLETLGIMVIEVFPYAAKVRLFGKPIPRKTTVQGQRWLRQQLEPLIAGLDDYPSHLGHDELDALVAAYTAYLYADGRAEAIGDPDEGVIVVPAATPSRGLSLIAR